MGFPARDRRLHVAAQPDRPRGASSSPRSVRRAGLANMLGYTGETNVQGEQVQKLDEVANETFDRRRSAARGHCAAIASEEMEEVDLLRPIRARSTWSSSIRSTAPRTSTCNISIGTIFGVLRRNDRGSRRRPRRDFLSPGARSARRRLRPLRLLDDARDLRPARGRRARLHLRPDRRRVLPLAREHPRPRRAARRTRSTRATTSRWTDEVKRWSDVDQGGGQGRAAAPTAPLRRDARRRRAPHAPQGRHLRLPGRQEEPRAASCACSTRRTRSRSSSRPPAARPRPGAERILDIVPEALHQRVPLVLGSAHDVRRLRAVHARRAVKQVYLRHTPWASEPQMILWSWTWTRTGSASSSTQSTRSFGASLPHTHDASSDGTIVARLRSRITARIHS